jgi:hypothetical protein
MQFQRVATSKWKLGPRIDAQRRARLLDTSFEEVVEKIVQEATVDSCRLMAIDKYAGAQRALVRLCVSSRLVDIFHSGAGGYRAQFYLSVENGENANRFCIERLVPLIITSCTRQRNCRVDGIERSLRDLDAKIWICEGAWLKENKDVVRNLSVEFWEKNAALVGLRHRFEATWAKLTPEDEISLEVKGGCIDQDCQPLGIILKSKRSEEIHLHGYT